MAITGLSIESEKLDQDNPSSIAIGETLPYVIHVETDGGGADRELVLVSIRKAVDDSVVAQRRARVTIDNTTTGDVDGEFTEEMDSLRTSGSAGNYYLYAELASDITVNTGTELVFRVVLMTQWMVENIIFAGIPFVDINGNPLDPALIRRSIVEALAAIETDMGFPLFPKRIKTRGLANPSPTDCDDVKDPIHFKRDQLSGQVIQMRSKYVNSIQSMKLYFGEQLIWTVPENYISLREKAGDIRLLPFGAPQGIEWGGMMISLSVRGDKISDGWYIDYTTGWDENLHPIPADLLAGVKLYATIALATPWGDALSAGIASSSISMDGVSAQINTTASGIYNLLAAKLTNAREAKKEWLVAFRQRYRPKTLRFLGA